MNKRIAIKVLVVAVLVAQLGFGVAQLSAKSSAVLGQCTWHVNHCDYTGCTGTCAAQVMPEKPDRDKAIPPPPDQCWCLY
jgi:F0F1-type ATP synthase assembly protein I